MIAIRPAAGSDDDAIWAMLEPMIRAGDTYALPRGMAREEGLACCRLPAHEVFVAEADDQAVGTYYLQGNQKCGGDHVANCGYITAGSAAGPGQFLA